MPIDKLKNEVGIKTDNNTINNVLSGIEASDFDVCGVVFCVVINVDVINVEFFF